MRQLGKAANNFFHKQVICPVRDQTWPDKETVWSDKKIPSERTKLKIQQNNFTALIAQY